MFLYRVNELSCLLYNGYITQLGRMWESFYKFPAPFHPSKTLLRRTCLNAAFLFFFPSFLLFFSFPPSLLPSHPPFFPSSFPLLLSFLSFFLSGRTQRFLVFSTIFARNYGSLHRGPWCNRSCYRNLGVPSLRRKGL